MEFPNGGGLWFGIKVNIITTSPPDEFSSVVGNWGLPPYPLGYGPHKNVLALMIRQAGFSMHPFPVEFYVPLEHRETATLFVWQHIEKGKAVAGYSGNGVQWIKSFPANQSGL